MAKKMHEGETWRSLMQRRIRIWHVSLAIMQAPTLVITDGEHLKKYVNASNIQKYVDEELD